MKKISFILFVFIFLALALPSKVFCTNIEHSKTTSLQNDILGIIDYNKSITVDTLLKPNKLQLNKFPLQIKAPHHTPVWFRLELRNTTKEHNDFVVYHKLEAMDRVDFYVIKQNDTIEHFAGGSNVENSQKKIQSRMSACELGLDANETALVYAKVITEGRITSEFAVCDKDNFYQQHERDSTLWALFYGFLLSMILFYFTSFIIQTKVMFLLYSVHISILLFSISILTGFFVQIAGVDFFGFYNKGIIRVALPIAGLCLILMYINLLDIKGKSRVRGILLSFAAIDIFLFLFFTARVFIFHTTDSDSAISFSMYVFMMGIYMSAAIFMLGVAISKAKKQPIARFISVGIGIYGFATAFFILGIFGVLQGASWTIYIFAIALAWEAVWLSMAIAWKNRELQLQKENHEKQLAAQEKFVAMGEVTISIAHQWRQPLNKITALLLPLKPTPEIARIEQIALHMSQTIEDFMQFFQENKPKEQYLLSTQIQKSIDLFKTFAENSNMTIEFDSTNDIFVEGHPTELSQVITILLENAQDAFKKTQKTGPIVKIKITSDKKSATIEVLDNAEGVDNAVVKRIFEPFFSTKNSNNRTGVGLYIAKMIVEKSLHGQISVNNIADGACFYIAIPKEID